MELTNRITLGCDPEFFVKDKELDKFVPAYLTGITGTKENPQELEHGGAVQVDGMALEFNIRPADNANDFSSNIYNTIKDIRKQVDRKYQFVFKPFVKFDKDIFENTPSKYKELGCDPDYDRNGNEKTPPEGSNLLPVRAAGGHIHIGFCKDMDIKDPRYLEDCKMIANILGRYITFNFRGEDNWNRKRYYGSGISYRPKPYGIEIRTPSNNWVGWSKANKAILFNSIKNVMNKIINNTPIDSYNDVIDRRLLNSNSRTKRDMYGYYIRSVEPYKERMIGVNF